MAAVVGGRSERGSGPRAYQEPSGGGSPGQDIGSKARALGCGVQTLACWPVVSRRLVKQKRHSSELQGPG